MESDKEEATRPRQRSLSGRLIYNEKQGGLEFVVDEVQPDRSRAYEYIDNETGEKVWVIVVDEDKEPHGKDWVEQFD
jgi:hypothetical protein